MVLQRPSDGSKQALLCYAVFKLFLSGSCAVFNGGSSLTYMPIGAYFLVKTTER